MSLKTPRSQRQRTHGMDGDYPPDWPEIAKRVKEAAGWKCVRCGQYHDPESGYTLTVHHLDMNKSNCADWNLAALCQRCHLRIRGVRPAGIYRLAGRPAWDRHLLPVLAVLGEARRYRVLTLWLTLLSPG